ncbi:MAG: metallophosphoesterase [Saprospiraceae bacterium]
MRLLILIAFLLAIDVYAFQAFRVMMQNWSATTRTVLTVLYWSIPVLALVLMAVAEYTSFPQTSKATYSFLRTIVFIAYISKFLIMPVLLIDDLRRLISLSISRFGGNPEVDLSRSRFLSQLGILMGSVPFVTLTYGIIRNPYRYQLHKKTVAIKDLPAELVGLKIVQISDIHSGSFTLKDPVRNAIDMINQVNADLVFFTGDIVNNVAAEMLPFVDVFNQIKAKYGVFSVLGNHDYGDYAEWDNPEAKRANLNLLKDIHKRMGWNLLLNENRVLDINGQPVAVIGVENYSALARFPKYGDLSKAYQGSDAANLKLLLSHDPTHWDAQITKDFSDIAITFSGHTHGFQFGVEIPGFKWSPAQYIYEQWAGLYQKGTQYLYVNRGLGFLGYPGRVGILPEVTLLELQKA